MQIYTFLIFKGKPQIFLQTTYLSNNNFSHNSTYIDLILYIFNIIIHYVIKHLL